MALDKIRLRNKIHSALCKCLKENGTPEKAFLNIATELSNAIDEYIKSADVIDISVDVDGVLKTDFDLPIDAEVQEGLTVSGRGYTQNGPIQVVAETVEKGKVIGSVKGKHDTTVDMICKQNGPGKLR